MTSKELREQRANAAKTIRELADKANNEKRDFNSEESEQWAKVNADYDSLTKQIERAERVEAVETEQRSPVLPGRQDYNGQAVKEERASLPTEELRSKAIAGWARYQAGLDLTEEQREACETTGVNPRSRFFDYRLSDNFERRAGATTSGSVGGYIVPQGFGPSLETAMLQYCNLLQFCKVWRTASGNPIPWATCSDTSNKGALLASENTDVLSQDLAFGQVNFSAYPFTSKFVKVSFELLEDSAFNLAPWIGERIGERLGRVLADYGTTGTGTSQPQGFIAGGSTGVTAASATAIAADELYDLEASLDPAYRPGASFVMHSNVLTYLRKLKDGEGRYLYVPGLISGQPDRLLGYPVYINQSMDSSVATGNETIAFGDFSKHVIRLVGDVRMSRLDERFADTGTIAFLGLMRMDSRVLDAGTHPIKILVQP